MLKRPPKTAQQLLSTGPLAELSKRTHQAEHLNALWQQAVSPALAAASRCIAHRDDTLIIHVASPAWVTRIRITESEIIQRFNQIPEIKVNALNVQIDPSMSYAVTGSK